MTTVTLLRQTYLNTFLMRAEADDEPWTDAQCDRVLTDALGDLWPDLGARATGLVATDGATDRYLMPGGIAHVSRIDVENGASQRLDTVTNWRYFPDADPPTKVIISPPLQTGYNLRFYGFKPFADDGSDLLPRLENTVVALAASKAYGVLASALVNSQRQQGLDSGRVVDYQTAIGLSAYWRREYENAMRGDPNLVTNGPRASLRR